VLVVDASVVASVLIGSDDDAEWASSMLLSGPLCAPHLLPVEVASVLRRAAAAGDISSDAASLAYAELLDLRMDLYPFAPLAVRVWEMRDNVRCYDAWYVALAELLGVPLVTLDRRLAGSAAPRCEIRTPPVSRRG
jgi:predicted nucleic acid-binding protein